MVAKPPQEAVTEIVGQNEVLTVVGYTPAFTVGVEQAVSLVAGALASDELRPGDGLRQPGVLQLPPRQGLPPVYRRGAQRGRPPESGARDGRDQGAP